MTQDKVMLLIDADNVSLDVIEQAVAWVGKHFGGPHVRRAYCTAESAVKHQAAFKRLSIRPMVNLAAGKNSTDIALAVDAIDLTLAERPDVVVIASSDSDFAPLVSRLREKGCRVIGVGQQGKTGDETRAVYDDYEVMEHRKAKPQGGNEARAEGRGKGRSDSRGDGRGEGRAEPRREGRSEGRGEGRGEGRSGGRSGGRGAGRGAGGERAAVPSRSAEPAALPLEALDHPAAAEVVQESPAAPPSPEPQPMAVEAAVAMVPSETVPQAPAETRPARARSRGGRRKPQVETLPDAGPQAEPSPAAPVPAPAPEPMAEAPSAPAKPARKPRRRRSAAAKRPADHGAGSLP